jgi:hypothetical protein
MAMTLSRVNSTVDFKIIYTPYIVQSTEYRHPFCSQNIFVLGDSDARRLQSEIGWKRKGSAWPRPIEWTRENSIDGALTPPRPLTAPKPPPWIWCLIYSVP